jgi:hypothetical protein
MIKLQPFARTAFHALTFVALPYEQTDRFEDRLARCTCESLYILKGFNFSSNLFVVAFASKYIVLYEERNVVQRHFYLDRFKTHDLVSIESKSYWKALTFRFKDELRVAALSLY